MPSPERARYGAEAFDMTGDLPQPFPRTMGPNAMAFASSDRAAAERWSRGLGRVHALNGYALRMTLSTAAITLAQLEIIRPAVAHIDKMIRLISDGLAKIPGITPTPIPDHVDVYSCWMAGFSIDPSAFTCDTDAFAKQVADLGLTGAGTGRYYLMPAALPFLTDQANKGIYPYSRPPASRTYDYRAETCPERERLPVDIHPLERLLRKVPARTL